MIFGNLFEDLLIAGGETLGFIQGLGDALHRSSLQSDDFVTSA